MDYNVHANVSRIGADCHKFRNLGMICYVCCSNNCGESLTYIFLRLLIDEWLVDHKDCLLHCEQQCGGVYRLVLHNMGMADSCHHRPWIDLNHKATKEFLCSPAGRHALWWYRQYITPSPSDK
jgi:hypothetical protein